MSSSTKRSLPEAGSHEAERLVGVRVDAALLSNSLHRPVHVRPIVKPANTRTPTMTSQPDPELKARYPGIATRYL